MTTTKPTSKKPIVITPEVKAAVNAVLVATTYAQTVRAEVDKIERGVLEECPLHFSKKIRREAGDEKVITEPSRAWMGDEAEFLDFCQESSKRERAAGIKPPEMPDEHCPALVAECIVRDAEHLLIECTASMLGVDDSPADFINRLLCQGMETYRKFIDLAIRMVVASPDFKKPKIA